MNLERMRTMPAGTAVTRGRTPVADPATLRLLRKYLAELVCHRDRCASRVHATGAGAENALVNQLYIAALAMVDLVHQGAAAAGEPRTADTALALDRLVARGRLGQRLAERLLSWVQLRHQIAHHHARKGAVALGEFLRPAVDPQRLHAAVAYQLPDLQEFAAAAAAWR
jgi:hypothetical protein